MLASSIKSLKAHHSGYKNMPLDFSSPRTLRLFKEVDLYNKVVDSEYDSYTLSQRDELLKLFDGCGKYWLVKNGRIAVSVL